MVVLFPAPFVPIYPTISPSLMVKETSSKALTSSYSLENSALTAFLSPGFLFETLKDFDMPFISIIDIPSILILSLVAFKNF
ncbi:hypothetical protein SDC9_89914 [bioreactor metagenome]|uniref:Uncharacterized protein n=1 Tax=bioreactor metagenome TaxID=1076179 RepID=A0A644ZTM1_9ZZZZ